MVGSNSVAPLDNRLSDALNLKLLISFTFGTGLPPAGTGYQSNIGGGGESSTAAATGN